MSRHQGIRAKIVEYLEQNGHSTFVKMRESMRVDSKTLWINLMAACKEKVVNKIKTDGFNEYDVGVVKTRHMVQTKVEKREPITTHHSITPPPYRQQLIREQLGMKQWVG